MYLIPMVICPRDCQRGATCFPGSNTISKPFAYDPKNECQEPVTGEGRKKKR